LAQAILAQLILILRALDPTLAPYTRNRAKMGRGAAITSSIENFNAARNPALARVKADTSLPTFEEGKDFRLVCLESGSMRNDLPVNATTPGAIRLAQDTDVPSPSRVDVDDVPGGFLLHDVLTTRECDQMIKLSETFGYTEDAAVSMARNMRQNENCVWIADDPLCDTLFERCRGLLPPEVQGGEVCGFNARWRLYKYGPLDRFKPHIDGSWPGSGLDASGKLVRDRYGDRWSQLTIVFYLNDDFEGGETRFFYPTGVGNQHRVAEMKATRGGAVCFYHGEHPQSPLHEGGLVTAGTKYIIRSDVLYKLPGSGQDSLQSGWQSHYAQVPPGDAEDMLAESS